MTDRIDIAEPIAEICRRLGFEPRNVAAIHQTPGEVTVLLYKTNENGEKYMDLGTHHAATEWRTIRVLS